MSSFLLTGDEWSALRLSAIVAFGAVLVSAVPGVALAWLLARREFPGKSLLDAIIHLPLVLPPVVIGYLLLLLLGRRGVIGAWLHDTLGVDIAFTRSAAVLAAAVMGFPLLVRAVRLGVELVDRRLEDAARTLGAGPWRALWTLLWEGRFSLLTAVLAGFGRASAEVGAVMIVGGNIDHLTRVMTTAIALETSKGDLALALGLGLILIILSTGVNGGAFLLKEAAQRSEG